MFLSNNKPILFQAYTRTQWAGFSGSSDEKNRKLMNFKKKARRLKALETEIVSSFA